MDKSVDVFDRAPESVQIARVEAMRPFAWLERGWQDFTANAGPSLAHGLILVGLGWLILLLFSAHIDLLAAAVSGFLLVGPVVAAGFYELSRLRAAGQPATFDASVEGAARNGRPLARLGLALAALAIAWVVVSHLLFVQAFGGTLPPLSDTFYRTVVDWDNYGFLATYLATGAVFAVVAFALAAVSAPMIFDRATPTEAAIAASIRTVAANPAAMLVWAVLIAVLTAIGFATFLLGLVIVLPLLGHATWHAYRDLIR